MNRSVIVTQLENSQLVGTFSACYKIYIFDLLNTVVQPGVKVAIQRQVP